MVLLYHSSSNLFFISRLCVILVTNIFRHFSHLPLEHIPIVYLYAQKSLTYGTAATSSSWMGPKYYWVILQLTVNCKDLPCFLAAFFSQFPYKSQKQTPIFWDLCPSLSLSILSFVMLTVIAVSDLIAHQINKSQCSNGLGGGIK